jgi:hypothetical protein
MGYFLVRAASTACQNVFADFLDLDVFAVFADFADFADLIDFSCPVGFADFADFADLAKFDHIADLQALLIFDSQVSLI